TTIARSVKAGDARAPGSTTSALWFALARRSATSFTPSHADSMTTMVTSTGIAKLRILGHEIARAPTPVDTAHGPHDLVGETSGASALEDGVDAYGFELCAANSGEPSARNASRASPEEDSSTCVTPGSDPLTSFRDVGAGAAGSGARSIASIPRSSGGHWNASLMTREVSNHAAARRPGSRRGTIGQTNAEQRDRRGANGTGQGKG